jgi:hypothetical protein
VTPSKHSSIATCLKQKPAGNGITDPRRKKRSKKTLEHFCSHFFRSFGSASSSGCDRGSSILTAALFPVWPSTRRRFWMAGRAPSSSARRRVNARQFESCTIRCHLDQGFQVSLDQFSRILIHDNQLLKIWCLLLCSRLGRQRLERAKKLIKNYRRIIQVKKPRKTDKKYFRTN